MPAYFGLLYSRQKIWHTWQILLISKAINTAIDRICYLTTIIHLSLVVKVLFLLSIFSGDFVCCALFLLCLMSCLCRCCPFCIIFSSLVSLLKYPSHWRNEPATPPLEEIALARSLRPAAFTATSNRNSTPNEQHQTLTVPYILLIYTDEAVVEAAVVVREKQQK